MPLTYPLDLTGQAPTNLITNESHTVGAGNWAFVPNAGPFFTAGLVVQNASGQSLFPNVQYKAVDLIPDATQQAGKEVCGAIIITDETQTGNILVTYQAIGGNYSNTVASIEQTLQALSLLGNQITWGQILNVPQQFVPTDHTQDANTLYGMDEAIYELEGIRQAILLGDQRVDQMIYAYIDQAVATQVVTQAQYNLLNSSVQSLIQTHLNAAAGTILAHDPAHVGLGNVANWAPGTLQDHIQGTTNLYATCAGVLNLLAASGLSPTGGGGSSTATAASIGLGNVVNWPVATDAETVQGSANFYASAAGVAYAISQITPSMVGLGNVANITPSSYPISTTQAAALAQKVNTSVNIAVTGLLTGGGNLSGTSVTIGLAAATNAVAVLGSDTTTVMTPASTNAAIQALAPVQTVNNKTGPNISLTASDIPGVLTLTAVVLAANVDFNTITNVGFYRLEDTTSSPNSPPGGVVSWGQLIVSRGQDTIVQIASTDRVLAGITGAFSSVAPLYCRMGYNIGTTPVWSPWRMIITDDMLSQFVAPLMPSGVTPQVAGSTLAGAARGMLALVGGTYSDAPVGLTTTALYGTLTTRGTATVNPDPAPTTIDTNNWFTQTLALTNGDVYYRTDTNGAGYTPWVRRAMTGDTIPGNLISGTVANATTAATANAVAGANVSGTVGHAALADNATVAATANAVAGANVSGTVASAVSAIDAAILPAEKLIRITANKALVAADAGSTVINDYNTAVPGGYTVTLPDPTTYPAGTLVGARFKILANYNSTLIIPTGSTVFLPDGTVVTGSMMVGGTGATTYGFNNTPDPMGLGDPATQQMLASGIELFCDDSGSYWRARTIGRTVVASGINNNEAASIGQLKFLLMEAVGPMTGMQVPIIPLTYQDSNNVTRTTDLNNQPRGMALVTGTYLNTPTPGNNYGTLITMGSSTDNVASIVDSSNWFTQIFYSTSGKVYLRMSIDGAGWGAWAQFAMVGPNSRSLAFGNPIANPLFSIPPGGYERAGVVIPPSATPMHLDIPGVNSGGLPYYNPGPEPLFVSAIGVSDIGVGSNYDTPTLNSAQVTMPPGDSLLALMSTGAYNSNSPTIVVGALLTSSSASPWAQGQLSMTVPPGCSYGFMCNVANIWTVSNITTY